MTFNRYNTIIGLLLFVISTTIYTLTVEPSVSFWDCGEWIAVGYGLQVGHPPGAPLYVLIARIFSLFSFGNVADVAYCINMLSAMTSGLTVMFLFWTATFFLTKILSKSPIQHPNIVIFVSAIAGSLVFAFSDTFWTSATESEVYSLSSLMSAIMFWCITKYCSSKINPNKWLLLICFLIGLAFNIHILSFLVIPAIVMAFYFNNYKHTLRNTLLAMLVSVGMLVGVLWCVIPAFFYLMAECSVLFVNKIGMSVNASVLLYISAIFALLIIFVCATTILRKPTLRFASTAFTYLVIGLTLQCITMWSSQADTYINEASPDNPKTLFSYIQRNQYTKPPIVYGQYYTAPFDHYTDGKPEYDIIYLVKKNDKIIDTCYSFNDTKVYKCDDKDLKIIERYIVADSSKNKIPVYNKEFCTFFPRMWKTDENCAHNYYSWTNGNGNFVEINNNKVYKPSFIDNISFFFNYQVGYMYIRYLMWNFSGKFEDVSNRDYVYYNQQWITGINMIDKLLGKKTLSENSVEGKRHNTYFMLPFVLAFIGFFFQLYKDTHNNIIISLLFLFTGFAIVVYLNSAPYEPRERDYVYVISFYAFAIWISMGIFCIFYLVQKVKALCGRRITAFVALLMLSIPALVAYENWDDHNRSKQYLPHDLAYNFLQSCAQNAILFTNGDNDTFPLWYLQQVEGIRTDVRVINLSLLSMPWYVEQITLRNNENDTIRLSVDKKNYYGNKLEMTLTEYSDTPISLNDAIKFVCSDSSTINIQGMPAFNYLNSNYVYITTMDSASGQCVETDFVLPEVLLLNTLMHLDIINNNYTLRPIYYTDYALTEVEFIEDYLQLEGLTYRLNMSKQYDVNVDTFYDNVMNKFKWGDVDEEDYINPISAEMLDMMIKNVSKLIETLQYNGDYQRSEILQNKIYKELRIKGIEQ